MTATSESRALAVTDFDAAMAPLGPFEARPGLAVAVSGGSDSLALTLLADHWCRARGGRLLALTVNHGLRDSSADEAAACARMLAERGIDHRILVWQGPKPKTGLQAAAREARYHLLSMACREAGVLHLLLAHHLEDQAETLLLRLTAKSGLAGLAGMAPIVYRENLRLLRPLLDQPRDRVSATLAASGLVPLEDPSNRDPRFTRVRLRQLLPLLDAGNLGARRIATAARVFAKERCTQEAAAADCLAATARLHFGGIVSLSAEAFLAWPRHVGQLALANLLRTLGGAQHHPGPEALDRFYHCLFAGERGTPKSANLARVRGLPKGGWVFLFRELRHLPRLSIEPGEAVLWDRRFRLFLPATAKADGPYEIAPLGRVTAREFGRAGIDLPDCPLAALSSLPALWGGGKLLFQPHLPARFPDRPLSGRLKAEFRPDSPASGVFTLV